MKVAGSANCFITLLVIKSSCLLFKNFKLLSGVSMCRNLFVLIPDKHFFLVFNYFWMTQNNKVIILGISLMLDACKHTLRDSTLFSPWNCNKFHTSYTIICLGPLQILFPTHTCTTGVLDVRITTSSLGKSWSCTFPTQQLSI